MNSVYSLSEREQHWTLPLSLLNIKKNPVKMSGSETMTEFLGRKKCRILFFDQKILIQDLTFKSSYYSLKIIKIKRSVSGSLSPLMVKGHTYNVYNS